MQAFLLAVAVATARFLQFFAAPAHVSRRDEAAGVTCSASSATRIAAADAAAGGREFVASPRAQRPAAAGPTVFLPFDLADDSTDEGGGSQGGDAADPVGSWLVDNIRIAGEADRRTSAAAAVASPGAVAGTAGSAPAVRRGRWRRTGPPRAREAAPPQEETPGAGAAAAARFGLRYAVVRNERTFLTEYVIAQEDSEGPAPRALSAPPAAGGQARGAEERPTLRVEDAAPGETAFGIAARHAWDGVLPPPRAPATAGGRPRRRSRASRPPKARAQRAAHGAPLANR